MPIPATQSEFLDLVAKSTLVEPAVLDAFLQQLRFDPVLPETPDQLAAALVLQGLLTSFQAELLLQGKWRGFLLGRYKVLQPIGAGGMGSVYLCEHRFMRRRAALKVLPPERAKNPADLERFYREARAVAALDHPNIVRAYDIDREGKFHYLAMEYVEGASLQQIVMQQGPLSPLKAASYLRQAALGLHHAYSAGLIHRDVKPANLLVEHTGVVKLLDLGLARFFHDVEDDISVKNEETVLGTADFVAPEQAINSHSVDIRADIYSLGATFYFCLTGRPPFPGGSIAHKLMAHCTGRPQPIRNFRDDVPAELIAILDKMMARKPEKRYATPADVAVAVTSLPILGGDAVSLDTLVMGKDRTLKESSRTRRLSRERQMWWLRLAGALVAIGISVFWYLLWRALRGPGR
jgi:serine/threonine protein kinase